MGVVVRENQTVGEEVCTIHEGTHPPQGVLCCSEGGL